ncbi:two-component regulator propeller domain-containing protein [Taibaiella sp. KBW10]|uniref:sensor histidine kinase n=1 Tax=Taibaiella sp. KBW10 TaxID=2153357 RepID=UPI0013156C3F|nr:two-component regulator propeller domain-containing protein [Taibaiella sp. KBW10]
MSAQEYNITNYRWEQGFAATTGYILFQDSKGYIWIGSENGLMRYNGYDFKMYTTRDGLPDNEILGIEEDDQGRIWFLPFANAICYMKDGQIFNPENDSLLHKLAITERPHHIYADRQGTVWIVGRGMFIAISKENKISRIHEIGGYNIGNSDVYIWLNSDKELMASVPEIGNEFYHWNGKQFDREGYMPFKPEGMLDFTTTFLYNTATGNFSNYFNNGLPVFSVIRKFPRIQFSFDRKLLFKDKLFVSSDRGMYKINISTGKVEDQFLQGTKIGSFILAKDGSLWFGSIGQGIYRFLKTPIKSIDTKLEHPSVIFIKGTDNGMYCTTDKVVHIKADFTDGKEGYKIEKAIIDKDAPYSRYLFLEQNESHEWLGCSGYISLRKNLGGKMQKTHNIYTKAVLEEDATHLLIGAYGGIFRLNKKSFQVEDTFLYDQRIVTLAKINNLIYAGTLKGLLVCHPDKQSYPVLPDNPHFKKHIMALCATIDEQLWVANSDAELIALKNDTITKIIGLKNGLQCNRISCLKASDTLLWVGTDNGLFAISLFPPHNIVKYISYETGLKSNQVNCIDIYKGRVWVGTIEGINYFDESDVLKKRDTAAIIFNKIQNGDDVLLPSNNIIRLKDKPLSIDFDIVEFSGGLKPVFQYRLDKHQEWTTIEGNQLYFPTLPYGKFEITIRGLSPNWGDGIYCTQFFYNPAPFYRTWWFFFLLLFAGISLMVIITFIVIKRIRSRDKSELAIRKNLLRLEQMALQGQLNPHFIFNSIAAIKQYYSSGNLEKGDLLVDSFSNLVRLTFEMGTETFVSLDKELSYLSEYLNVELIRFHDSFSYHIEKETSIPESRILIPAMLLQPIVENAIRHGIRHLPDGKGKIHIFVKQVKETVAIWIKDNGIGRLKSRELQANLFTRALTSSNVIEKRVAILNRLFDGKIMMHTSDVLNEMDQVAGTTIFISYPLNLNELLKDESSYN